MCPKKTREHACSRVSGTFPKVKSGSLIRVSSPHNNTAHTQPHQSHAFFFFGDSSGEDGGMMDDGS